MSKKYVRPFTPAWRWFIALGSVGAFVGGWAVLAHTPNPYETAQASDAPALEAPTTVPAPTQAPLQNTRRSRRQRQLERLPAQRFGETRESEDEGEDEDEDHAFTLPNMQPQPPSVQVQPVEPVQPNSQSQLPTTRTRTRLRLRTGGS
jgi:hypothetical protein